ncbi:hypothetical protein LX36DRAFT_74053 [Colletotrichum falcatum]|nr:hypothetical protein LX36DRAFT_74053 [Colletotrichum falcatum]
MEAGGWLGGMVAVPMAATARKGLSGFPSGVEEGEEKTTYRRARNVIRAGSSKSAKVVLERNKQSQRRGLTQTANALQCSQELQKASLLGPDWPATPYPPPPPPPPPPISAQDTRYTHPKIQIARRPLGLTDLPGPLLFSAVRRILVYLPPYLHRRGLPANHLWNPSPSLFALVSFHPSPPLPPPDPSPNLRQIPDGSYREKKREKNSKGAVDPGSSTTPTTRPWPCVFVIARADVGTAPLTPPSPFPSTPVLLQVPAPV